jgi:hypothetical protein
MFARSAAGARSMPYDPTDDPYLTGAFAPTQSELDATPVEVVAGTLPEDLRGTYYRNGPNARFPPLGSYTYPLDGDGMIHALRFDGGRVTYANRYVRTPSMAAEERAGRALWGGVMTPFAPKPEEGAGDAGAVQGPARRQYRTSRGPPARARGRRPSLRDDARARDCGPRTTSAAASAGHLRAPEGRPADRAR